jgi:hypothetical protein
MITLRSWIRFGLSLCVSGCMFLALPSVGRENESELVVRIEDPEGNLEGDANRTFLDLITVEAEVTTEDIVLTLHLAGEFPDPRSLPGMGMLWKFLPHCEEEAIDHEDRSSVAVRLDVAGWRADWNPKAIDAGMLLQHPLSLGVEYRNRFTLTIPRVAWPEVRCLTILASTAEFPKWKPVTRHPPITLHW